MDSNWVFCDRTRINGSKLKKKERFKLGVSKKFFRIKLVKPWHRLPREAVGGYPWSHPKSDWMGSEYLIGLWASLYTAQGL